MWYHKVKINKKVTIEVEVEVLFSSSPLFDIIYSMLYFLRQTDNKIVTMAHFIVHSVTFKQILIILFFIA